MTKTKDKILDEIQQSHFDDDEILEFTRVGAMKAMHIYSEQEKKAYAREMVEKFIGDVEWVIDDGWIKIPDLQIWFNQNGLGGE